MAGPIDIRLLGPFEVLAGGSPVNVSGSKRRGLLALLALRRGRLVAVDALVEALWDDDLPTAPRNAVQHHVARLRNALGHDSIVASSNGYALMEANVDALRFEELLEEARVALREADARAAAEAAGLGLELWRGPALHGLTETAWFTAEARRLEALRVDALEEGFEAALAFGEHREIVSGLRAALDESPFRERLWGQLMLALYRCGRQADALEAFQDARRLLSEELGLEPGPQLRRLQEEILTHDPVIAPLALPARRRGNLPTPSTSFVDREEALAEVVALLQEHRLVTLTGPPGVGKSRLALEVARSFATEVRDGVWWIEFKDAHSLADVARLVARAVAVRGADPLARIVTRLRNADAILVLDGCWHVADEVANVGSAVLAECPGVRLLVTSRRVLHAPGEVRVTVEPLRLLDPESGDAAGSPAVQLFVERARAARPRFALTAETASLVAEIARELDGLPLAIELAAARADVLGLAELLSLVKGRLEFLSGRQPSDAANAAMATLVEWSHDLLHSDERTLLHQVSVHRGGASFGSLVSSGARHGLDEPTVAYLLTELVDKSIVLVSFVRGEARYDVLDTVRDYAVEQLAETGGLAAARQAHAEYFAGLADEARTGLRGPEWQRWLARLELEHDNLWAAVRYAREAADPETAGRLGALGWYFSLAERVTEGREFLEIARASVSYAGPLHLRLELLAWLCFLATEERDFDAAIEAGDEALALSANAPSLAEWALVRTGLALAYAHSGDHERSAALADEARAGYDLANDDWGRALSTLVRGGVAALAGDLTTFAAMTEQGRRQAEAAGYTAFVPPALLFEARVAEQRGDRAAAANGYRCAFDASVDAAFPDHASVALAGLASVALAEDDLREAEALFRRALVAGEANHSAWAAANARVGLARTLAAGGDTSTAEKLYQAVVEWSEGERAHQGRETQFVALAGDPGARALLGLAKIAEANGDASAAERLRSRAALAVA